MTQPASLAPSRPVRVEPPAEQPKLTDLMQGRTRIDRTIHERGLVSLLDVMPRLVPEGQTADMAIVQAASVMLTGARPSGTITECSCLCVIHAHPHKF